jgi:hypothetical protein
MTYFIIQIFCLITGFAFLYFKSYSSEKGKNLATKEDIGEITKTVETIKTELAKDTEKLKTELLFENQLKISFYNDKKVALTHIYECLTLWFHCITNSHTNSIEFSLQNFREVNKELDDLYSKSIIAQSKIEIYINNSEFINVIEQIIKSLITSQNELEKYLDNIESIVEDETELENETTFDGDFIIPVDNESELNNLNEKKLKLFNEYGVRTSPIEKEIYSKFFHLAELCRNILTNKMDS